MQRCPPSSSVEISICGPDILGKPESYSISHRATLHTWRKADVSKPKFGAGFSTARLPVCSQQYCVPDAQQVSNASRPWVILYMQPRCETIVRSSLPNKSMSRSPQSTFPPPLRDGSIPRLRALLLGMEAQRHTTGRCEKTGAFGASSFDLKPERNNQGNFLTMARSKTS